MLGALRRAARPPRAALSHWARLREHPNEATCGVDIPGTTIVRDERSALAALRVLDGLRDRVHAWDTETVDISVKEVSPVGNGRVLSAQAFCGADAPFENGPYLFIDNVAERFELIQLFKPYFEDASLRKVWFNYSFDSHMLRNHGIRAAGFEADVMHLARLLDSSRGPKEYSLAQVSAFYAAEVLALKREEAARLRALPLDAQRRRSLEVFESRNTESSAKVSMKKLFVRARKLKSGEDGKTFELPSPAELHTSPELVAAWIGYATLDAELTFFLHGVLRRLLATLPVSFEGMRNGWDIYDRYWRAFGELLVEMERRGMHVNRAYLERAKALAAEDVARFRAQFLQLVQTLQPEATEFNPSSMAQLQQLLHAPFHRRKRPARAAAEPAEEPPAAEEEEPDPLRVVRTLKQIDEFPEVRLFKVEKREDVEYAESGPPRKDGSARQPTKFRMMAVRGFGIPAQRWSLTGLPSVDTESLVALADGPVQKHFRALGQPERGEMFVAALKALVNMRSTETLLHTFIESLLGLIDGEGKVHCSLNLNTETGRLSSRNPNLQNQPALDKDVYRTRLAFEAGPGAKLIIADYGQLELRVLAIMTGCRSMITALNQGGDFHSRTAAAMFPHIKKELAAGTLLLEKGAGGAGVPVLKEKYAAERKKAKTMNFSVAYGKTAFGFAKDWNCSLREAERFLELWYADRPEVRAWQEQTKRVAIEKGFARTLMGRYRNVTKYFLSGQKMQALHGLRSAINTPIQGGAADIVIAAMVKLGRCERLQELGWNLVHQVHDEVILEGPKESAEEALGLVKEIMEKPIDVELPIKIEVDPKICDNWYEKS